MTQTGGVPVVKHVPASAAKVEIVSFAVLRLSVYKDAWPGPWQALCMGPLKAVFGLSELWGSNFASIQLRPCVASEADVFSVFIRMPLGLREPLLSFLAQMAYSLSPETMPATQEITLHRQAQEHAIGAARTGLRLGIRCLQQKEEELHAALRAAVPFLGSHADKIYHARSLPYGAQRHAVAKTLKALGWVAGSGGGLRWSIQG